jgi:hypothetical protein
MTHKYRHAKRQKHTKSRKPRRTGGGVTFDETSFRDKDLSDLDALDLYDEDSLHDLEKEFSNKYGDLDKYNPTVPLDREKPIRQNGPPVPAPSENKNDPLSSLFKQSGIQPEKQIPSQMPPPPPPPSLPQSSSSLSSWFPPKNNVPPPPPPPTQEVIPEPIRMEPPPTQQASLPSSAAPSSWLGKILSNLSLAGEKLKNWALEKKTNPDTNPSSPPSSVPQQGGRGGKRRNRRNKGKENSSRRIRPHPICNKNKKTHKRKNSIH